MKNLTSSLYSTEQTVFTIAEIGLLWKETQSKNLKSKIYYHTKSGLLTPLRRGIYALGKKEYNRFELANRIFTPSYVSLETILAVEGVVFQKNDAITSVSYQTRGVEVDNKKYSYRRINPEILTNPLGITHNGSSTIATKERAFLDSLYLNGRPYFDHLDNINWSLCRQILPIYKNKQLEKRFSEYARH